MEKRIKEKIEEFMGQLKQIAPNSFEEYESNIEKKAACERYVEKIVEALTDLAFLVIKLKRLKIPEDDIAAFSILSDNKVVNTNLLDKLKMAKGMRNIIAHEYGKIDDNIVFESITEELGKDVREFVESIRKYLGTKKNKKAS